MLVGFTLSLYSDPKSAKADESHEQAKKTRQCCRVFRVFPFGSRLLLLHRIQHGITIPLFVFDFLIHQFLSTQFAVNVLNPLLSCLG